MQSVDAVKLVPVWVNPEHLVGTAQIILQGYGLRVLAVIDGGRLVGAVTRERLGMANENTPVSSVMEPIDEGFDGATPTRQVAASFVERNLEYAPIIRDGRFLGVLTAIMLLKELGRSYDPLTGLSWSDRLRDWGIEQLREGREVTILFIDLDDFGQFNKLYGHIVGDRVIRHVADLLGRYVDPSTDLLVRYGGDEFAICTIRTREDALELAETLSLEVSGGVLPDAAQPVSFAIGMYGGRRTKERDNVHYASTLDSLINLASKDCIANKGKPLRATSHPQPLPTHAVTAEASPEAITVVHIHADESPHSLTQVVLKVNGVDVTGVHARSGKPLIESVSIATCRAMERAYPECKMEVESVLTFEDEGQSRLIRLQGILNCGSRRLSVEVTCPVQDELYVCAAKTTIQAFTHQDEAYAK